MKPNTQNMKPNTQNMKPNKNRVLVSVNSPDLECDPRYPSIILPVARGLEENWYKTYSGHVIAVAENYDDQRHVPSSIFGEEVTGKDFRNNELKSGDVVLFNYQAMTDAYYIGEQDGNDLYCFPIDYVFGKVTDSGFQAVCGYAFLVPMKAKQSEVLILEEKVVENVGIVKSFSDLVLRNNRSRTGVQVGDAVSYRKNMAYSALVAGEQLDIMFLHEIDAVL